MLAGTVPHQKHSPVSSVVVILTLMLARYFNRCSYSFSLASFRSAITIEQTTEENLEKLQSLARRIPEIVNEHILAAIYRSMNDILEFFLGFYIVNSGTFTFSIGERVLINQIVNLVRIMCENSNYSAFKSSRISVKMRNAPVGVLFMDERVVSSTTRMHPMTENAGNDAVAEKEVNYEQAKGFIISSCKASLKILLKTTSQNENVTSQHAKRCSAQAVPEILLDALELKKTVTEPNKKTVAILIKCFCKAGGTL